MALESTNGLCLFFYSQGKQKAKREAIIMVSDRQLLSEFEYHLLLGHGLQRTTIQSYLADLYRLLKWKWRKIDPDKQACELSYESLSIYLRKSEYLINFDHMTLVQYFAEDKRNQKKRRFNLNHRSQRRFISSFRQFFRFLIGVDYRKDDPTHGLKIPHFGRRLPISMSEAKIEALLDAPNVNTPIGLRDRAMIELLYACGLRVSELIGLTLMDINFERRCIRFIGKGNKERIVPIGREAVDWILLYIEKVRCPRTRTNALFVSKSGGFIGRQVVWCRIKRYAAMIEQPHISPHTLRHAFATHMINHGADIVVVQMLLGHSSLSSTQIYIHVAIARLKEIHRKYHPRG